MRTVHCFEGKGPGVVDYFRATVILETGAITPTFAGQNSQEKWNLDLFSTYLSSPSATHRTKTPTNRQRRVGQRKSILRWGLVINGPR